MVHMIVMILYAILVLLGQASLQIYSTIDEDYTVAHALNVIGFYTD